MKTIIAGGRNYKFTLEDIEFLLQFKDKITEVVCGMAKGADTGGKEWAEWEGIPVKEFPANWKKYGRGAGFIRNEEMAEYADMLIAFPGGNGTQHMKEIAEKHNLIICTC